MCRQTNASGDPNTDDDDRLAMLEAELTRELPDLFEAMNRASSEVNILERKANEAQSRYKQCLEQWRNLYKGLCAQHGAAIDCAKPYFDTAFSLEFASRRVRHCAHKLSTVEAEYVHAQAKLRAINDSVAFGAHEVSLDTDQQDGFSRAMVRVLHYEQERSKCEQEHMSALREYREIEESLKSWRTHVSTSTIRRMEPYFKQLQHYQLVMVSEQVRITEFSKRTQAAKKTYTRSMSELESINIAVHEAREEHARSLTAMLIFGEEEFVPTSIAAEGTEGVERSSRLFKETPEVTPEMVIFGEDEFAPNSKFGGVDAEAVPFLRLSEEMPEVTPEIVSELSACGATKVDLPLA